MESVITLPMSVVHPVQKDTVLPSAPLGMSTAPAHSATHVSVITTAFPMQPGKLGAVTGVGAGAGTGAASVEEQADDPANEVSPAAQLEQAEAPLRAAYMPAAQKMQVCCPAEAVALPGAHAKQPELVEYFPATQATWDRAPAPFRVAPGLTK